MRLDVEIDLKEARRRIESAGAGSNSAGGAGPLYAFRTHTGYEVYLVPRPRSSIIPYARVALTQESASLAIDSRHGRGPFLCAALFSFFAVALGIFPVGEQAEPAFTLLALGMVAAACAATAWGLSSGREIRARIRSIFPEARPAA